MASTGVAIEAEKEIKISCEAEFKQYPYNKAQDIWSLVTLKAPCHKDETTRAPIDLVAVIDKSGSMAGKKLSLVKMTLEFMLQQLGEDDRLSVVTYDSYVYLDFGLMKMTKDNKATCQAKIKSITDGSSTNLSGGLLKGLEQVSSRTGDKNEVASVLLFTDGLANYGITHAAGIVAAMKDEKMYRSTSEHSDPSRHQEWLRKVLGKGPVEHSEKQIAEKSAKEDGETKIPASVYTFGFGADHDPDLLKAISDAGNGMYYFIENEDKIAESFGHCLGGLLSTVGQGIQLNVVTQEGVKIKDVHTGRPFNLNTEKKSVKIDMGDLQSEESRDVVLELSIDALPTPREETSPQPLLEAEVNYFNVVLGKICSAQTSLNVLRSGTEENKPDEGSVTVNKQRGRIETFAAIKRATELADEGSYDVAMQHLEVQRMKNKSTPYSNDAEMEQQYEHISACSEALQNREMWKRKGKKMALNIAQMHEQQRSSETSAQGCYASRSKASMAHKFRSAKE